MEQKELKKMGHDLPMEVINQAFLQADEYFYNECARLPLIERSKEEKSQVFYTHQHLVQKYCGLKPTRESVLHIIGCYQEQCTTQVIFEDAAETLRILREKSLKIGLISNSDGDISPLLTQTGLDQLLDVVITSAQFNVTKPNAGIFQIALNKLGISKDQALYVGDQIEIDMAGAENAGIDALLIDRQDYYKNTPYSRINDMRQVLDYI